MTSRKRPLQVTLESLALLLAGITSLLAGVSTYIAVGPMQLRLATITDYGPFGAALVFFVVVVSFMFGYPNTESYQGVRGWRKVQQGILALLLAVAHAATAYLLVSALAGLAGSSLNEIMILPAGAVTLSVILAGMSAYIMYLYASDMSTRKLAGFLTLFMLTGGVASMIVAEDKTWWHIHISALGAGGETLSSRAFNATLMTGGVLIAGLAYYITTELRRVQRDSKTRFNRNRIILVRIAFILIGAAMLVSGLFPYDKMRWLHDLGANTMSYTFCLLAVGVPFLLPIFSKTFTAFSLLIVLAVWIDSLLSYFRMITLLQMEFFAALCFFAWLIVLVRNIAAIYTDQSRMTSEKSSRA